VFGAILDIMPRRLHCCIFLIGVSLLLLALALIVRVDFAASQAQTHPTVRVAQVVTVLGDGCLSCHVAPQNTPQWAYGSNHRPNQPSLLHPVSQQASSRAMQANVDTQLHDLGQRILALPELNTPAQTEVTEAFLLAYHETRNITADPTSPASSYALWRMGAIEQLLQLLENQASPYRWTTSDSKLVKSTAAVLSSPVSVSAAVLCYGTMLGDAESDYCVLCETYQPVMPSEPGSMASRRGPPAAVFLDSV
jgi:hypothetical protein